MKSYSQAEIMLKIAIMNRDAEMIKYWEERVQNELLEKTSKKTDDARL